MDLVHTHERVTHFDVMNIHVGTYIEGIWGEVRGDRRNRFKTWLKILTTPSIWAYMRLEKLHSQTAPGRFWVPDSDMVKREVQHYYPTPDDRFFIAHSGVDQPVPDAAERRTQWRAKLGLRADEVVALFVGSEFRRKGLPALLEAMGLLKDKAPHLVIVGGKAEEMGPYRKRAEELGINQHLTWAGRVSNVKDYYSLADIFILPTLSDASPIAPLEAMAYGSAAIVSNGRYTGAAELISNGQAIILEDPRNATEIAHAIERLLNPQTRQELARRGQDLVRDFTWDRTAAVILQAIEKSHKEKLAATGR
jgi:UDP-glucose:(heptosyl)LPS alpha-1,3-glucosyltransferase